MKILQIIDIAIWSNYQKKQENTFLYFHFLTFAPDKIDNKLNLWNQQ